jgi:spoIIIJ-associated protein
MSDQIETPENPEQETEVGTTKTSIKDLEEEGEVAADYLEELLDIFDLDGDINIDVRQGRAYLEVTADEESNLRLVSHPDTVEALQELTRIAVQTKTQSFSRLIIDIAGSRQVRLDALTKVVNKVIDKVKDTNTSVAMKPMSSYERKIAHDLIAEAGLISQSEGEGKERHIVAKPAE